ncbi:phage tail tape measure protein [Methylobacterium nodulans]|uniref:TP901 family phage tail tape measure protein n=1 Tax=Methylobacterium nodulans (strain LMG 21967 / CNCM I-2342 / ORS 2060) TaxID=460265 RepID=B8IDN8_METNO|nr:phage tail tape measure protein [Methylobacterium nodulans]ACL55610.1 TP901 family phage tail tape measure protein [Methylobacterium nodulans ORS 2060]
MVSKTASLIIRLTDDVSGPAGKAAQALKGLSTAGDGLSRLKNAASGLDQLGAKMRQAKIEVERAGKELAAAEKRVAFFRASRERGSHNYPAFEASGLVAEAEARLKAAKRAHAAAERQMAATRAIFVDQKRTVASLTASLSAASGGLKDLRSAETNVAGAAAQTTGALSRQTGVLSSVAGGARTAARAYRDLAAGMSEAGRKALATVEANRRLVEGMSAPARAAAAAAEAHRKAAMQGRADRAASRREALETIGAGAGLIAAHRGKAIGLQAVQSAASMDYATRYQHVATDVSEEDQRRLLIPQAKRIGQETKFSNEDIVHAQTATMQGLPFKDPALKARVGEALVDQARHYAVIMQSDMTRASEGIRSFLQNTNKDISTPEKSLAEAQRGTNLIVKMAKLGGMSDEDAQQFIKFGFPTGTQAGLSDVTLAALGASGRRAGLRGDELGVFARAMASKLVAPTSKGLDALTAAGIHYNRYTTMPGGLNVDNLEAFSKRRFGKGFTEDQRTRLADLLENSEVVGERDEFTKQVSAIVAEGFGKGKSGKTKAQDVQKIAKMVGDFHKLSVESVDTEGLLRAIFSNPKMTAALLNAFFTDKHGGKAGMIAPKMAQFNQDVEELKKIGEDPLFAERKSKYMTQGLGGSIDNLKGSFETMVLSIGQANEGLIRFAADGLAKGTDLFSNLSQTQQQILSLVGGGAAVAGGVWGTATLMKNLLGFGASAQALTGSAGLLSKSALELSAAAATLGGKGVLPEVAKTAAPVAAGAAGVTAGAIAGAVAAGVGTAALVYAAGGRYQPEEVVRMRDELSELNKRLERQNESVYRQQSQGDDATAEIARRDATLARIKELTAALEKAATAQGTETKGEEGPRAGLKLSEAAREALDARKAGAAVQAPPETVSAPAPSVRPPEVSGVTDAATKAGGEAPKPAEGASQAAPAAAPVMAPTVRAPAPPARPPELGQAPAPLPPARSPEMGLPPDHAAAIQAATSALATYRAELAGIERQLAGLQASGEAAFSPDLSGLEARKAEVEATIRGLEAKLQAIKPASTDMAPPDFAAAIKAAEKAGADAGEGITDGIRAQIPAAGRAGTEAGQNAGQGVAKGIEQEGPKAVDKAKTLWERIKDVFAEGVNIPINFEGGSGAAAITKASYVSLPGGAGADLGRPRSRLGSIAHRGGASAGAPGPAVSPQAEFGPGVDAARLPAGMRNNNPGNIKFTRVGAFGTVIGPSRNTDQGDPQAVFANAEDGMRALVDLARRKWEGGRQTVADLIARRGGWTPGNHQAAANIARGAGVGLHERIDLSDDAVMQRFVRALITQEHGPAGRLYSDELIRKALRPREAPAAQAAAKAPERPAIPGMMPGAERVNPGYGKPLHQGGTGLSRYSDEDLRRMRERQDALDRIKATGEGITPEQAEAARRRIQERYTPRPASPEATPGLTRPAPGVTPSGVPAITPKADPNGLDALGTKADGAKDKLAALSGVSISPQVSTGNLDALIAKANQALAALQRIPGAVASANASIASVSPAGAGGGSTGKVRDALSDNFA